MRLDFAPFALVVVSIAAVTALFVFAPNDENVVSSTIFLGSVVGYFVGAVWGLLRMRANPVAEGARLRRLAGILALSAPATIFSVGLFVGIVTAGDNMWMVLPYALAPGLIVWPFAIAALLKMKATISPHHPGR